ncbi:hypothetical protein N665_0027s0022 [Sinapis alba]|nr:hypothetical protein N665_0027s0022 [Sinapis alba]
MLSLNPGTSKRKPYDKWDIVSCPSCKALLWNEESLHGQNMRDEKQFSLCCRKGRVRLPPVREPPSPLQELFESSKFRPNIRVANSLLALTSMGAQVDQTVTGTPEPFTYLVHGQIIHRIGSLLLDDCNPPEYLQFYIYDTDDEAENMKKAFSRGSSSVPIEDNFISKLIEMLDNNNHLARIFRNTRDHIKTTGDSQFKITLVSQPGRGLGDITATSAGREIVIELKSSALHIISDLNPLMMSLQYPLAKKKYRDSMAICRWYGNPHLFITVTANPNWVELTNLLDVYGGDSANSRLDLECCLFKIKLDEMVADFFFKKFTSLNPTQVEWSEKKKKNPSKEVDNEGFDLVERHMIHGPCGKMHLKSPCMNKGECTKNYPKPSSYRTRIDKSRFVNGNIRMDNQYVVPHNISLLRKYQAHINVERCYRTSAIKYLFKYITKGVDRATVSIEKKDSDGNGDGNVIKKKELVNEIERFQQCRYISACEASWRIFAFPIHYNQPNIVKLPFHLHGQHRMVRDLTYVEFPSRCVYHTAGKLWTLRQQGGAIGRVVYIRPAAGDLYFLIILINVIRGLRSYDELCTVGDVVFKKFKQAIYSRGLLDDDKEWHYAIEELSLWARSHQLRRYLSEDILHMKQREFNFQDLVLEDKDLKQYTLLELKQLFKEHDQSLADYTDIPQPDKSILSEINNRVLPQDFVYNVQTEVETHRLLFSAMNDDQRNVYDVEEPEKTYLYRTLIARLRSVEKVVIPIARTAALLLPGGTAAHSRDLLAHEDPSAAGKPFAGKTVLLGCDFRKIMHVHPSKNLLWKMARVFTLSINIRLRQDDNDFVKWILEVGDGDAATVCLYRAKHEEGDHIIIDKDFMIPKTKTPREALANTAYPNFLHNYRNNDYLRETFVLTPTNNTVHEVNSYLLLQVPSQAGEYLSSDSIEIEATPDNDWTSHYTQEYLNSLEFHGLPNHRLCLKVGAPVMMLCNLNQTQGLCNGARMMISRVDIGEQVLIPQIYLSPTDTIHPFTFCRHQFPIRLCYAMTVNKSQSQILNQVSLYRPPSVFTHRH